MRASAVRRDLRYGSAPTDRMALGCRTSISAWALAALVLAPATTAAAAPCSDAQLHEILAPAEAGDDWAIVDCDLELSPLLAAAITRTLAFVGAASSGTTLDCHGGTLGSSDAGATILFASRRIGSSPIPGVGIWEPVTDVTVRDCEVIGRIRLRGMGVGERDDEAALSSHVPVGHVARVRAAAPQRITLDGVTVVGLGPAPISISWGVQDTTITRSYLTGWSNSVAIYLDAESTRTTIRDSTIDTDTRRELIAIDGSEDNLIVGNWFSHLEDGGIDLYRNCGERGAVRITPSRYNEIINNVFYYETYTGSNAAVSFGARNGPSTHRFCDADSAFGYGSGADDRDFATDNVVMQNQIYLRSPDDVFHTPWPETNTPNHVAWNETVTAAVSRPSGCYTPAGYHTSFLAHGESLDLFRDGRGHPYWSALELTCLDGELHYAWDDHGRVEEVPFSCATSGDNAGCTGSVLCPGAGRLVGARAACNLEHGPVTDAQLTSVTADTIRVVRASDLPWQGRCWIGARTVGVGELSVARSMGPDTSRFGCSEHDRNGGDCEIRGVAYCRYP